MQCAVIEFARNVLKWENANSTEVDPTTKHPVVRLRLIFLFFSFVPRRNFVSEGGYWITLCLSLTYFLKKKITCCQLKTWYMCALCEEVPILMYALPIRKPVNKQLHDLRSRCISLNFLLIHCDER